MLPKPAKVLSVLLLTTLTDLAAEQGKAEAGDTDGAHGADALAAPAMSASAGHPPAAAVGASAPAEAYGVPMGEPCGVATVEASSEIVWRFLLRGHYYIGHNYVCHDYIGPWLYRP